MQYITLQYNALHYIPLQCITIHCITLPYIALHYIPLHYTTTQYNTLHYNTLHYITLHYMTHTHTHIHMLVSDELDIRIEAKMQFVALIHPLDVRTDSWRHLSGAESVGSPGGQATGCVVSVEVRSLTLGPLGGKGNAGVESAAVKLTLCGQERVGLGLGG